METYFEKRNIDNTLRLKQLRTELPPFCSEYFIGIENTTSILTRLNYAYDLRLFFHFLTSEITRFKKNVLEFSINDLNAITVTDIELFLEYLSLYIDSNGKTATNGKESKSRKLSTIRSFFRYYFNKNYLVSDVSVKVLMPKIPSKPITRLDVDEIVKFLDEVETGDSLNQRQQFFHKKTKDRDLALLTLFLGTGIRISEAVGLDVTDFFFKTLSFKVTRKGGNQEILYFSDEVCETLLKYLKTRKDLLKQDNPDEAAMFLSLQGKRISVRAVQDLVKKYSTITTPLKHITPHKLRSTYGTNLYNETQDIYVVAEVLGHKDINTTKKHYAAISDDIKRNASRKVILREKEEN